MTAWSQLERAQLRRYLGYPSLSTQFEPRLENAITAVQWVGDVGSGGVMPTTDTQDLMRTAMANLAQVDALRLPLLPLLFTGTAANGATIKPAVALWDLQMEGRKYIASLEIALGTGAIRDYYTGEKLADTQGYGGNSVFPVDLG